MILKARHHFFFYPFFRFYAGWIIHRHFGRVELSGEFRDRKLPILLLANHFSWWDGFFAMYLNVNVIKRKFHFMMLEEQLKKYFFFNKTGGFSIRKNSRNIVESMNYTSELLHDQRNMVLLFPQGRIESVYKDPIRFESGIGHITGKAGDSVQILFMVNLIDYFSSSKPGLYMYMSEYEGSKYDRDSIQEAYNHFFRECITANTLKSND